MEEISKDTIIIEVKGGLVQEVHNDPNGYIIFDWDNIEEEDNTQENKELLKSYLTQLTK